METSDFGEEGDAIESDGETGVETPSSSEES